MNVTPTYCSQCGGPVHDRVPDGDDRPRATCPACGFIHYINPKIVVGCLPVHQERILLCRRAIEPRHGYWTLPSGYMENGESAEEGAARETWEEAGIRVRNLSLHTLYSIPHVDQVYLLFLAEQTGDAVPPGPETSEIRYFAPGDLPWDELAFRAVGFCLENYVRDGTAGPRPYTNAGHPWELTPTHP